MFWPATQSSTAIVKSSTYTKHSAQIRDEPPPSRKTHRQGSVCSSWPPRADKSAETRWYQRLGALAN
eukprot:10719802-Alexandrium_andersonii.AAC.1